MSSPSKEQIIDALRTVKDPELHRDLVSLDMIKHVAVCDGVARVHVELTTPACPLKAVIEKDVTEAVMKLPGAKRVELEWSARAVGAGKGGVGKSTAAVLLALGLQRKGAKVGLMDADVYGPSIPTLIGLEGASPEVRKDKIIPVEADGVKVMSMGFMIDPGRPVVWRGPMVHGVVKQFLEQVDWGELDYLIVDLPPGTGDVPLTMAQTIPMTGAVVICTPQDVAMADARRAIGMYATLKVDCLGIIENMSYYICPQCGHRDEIFDHGGAERAARELGVPFLGAIPLNAKIRQYGDSGEPGRILSDPDEHLSRPIDQVVGNLAGQISIKNLMPQAGAASSE
jgi:ATP-binding protein involved in chromosome partitioning